MALHPLTLRLKHGDITLIILSIVFVKSRQMIKIGPVLTLLREHPSVDTAERINIVPYMGYALGRFLLFVGMF